MNGHARLIISGLSWIGAIWLTSAIFGDKLYSSKYETELKNYIMGPDSVISVSENYKMKTLMGIQDSSDTYVPNLEDWKRGYENMLKEKNLEGKVFD
jgi:hypothetical protein